MEDASKFLDVFIIKYIWLQTKTIWNIAGTLLTYQLNKSAWQVGIMTDFYNFLFSLSNADSKEFVLHFITQSILILFAFLPMPCPYELNHMYPAFDWRQVVMYGNIEGVFQ